MAKKPKKPAKPKEDPEREHRIDMEVVVDCYDADERRMGWYGYLEDQLRFPFTATCVVQRATSPLRVGDEVEVIGMAPEEDCRGEMFVMMQWDRKEGLGVPLSQLQPISETDEPTREAVEDWHYWVQRGYEF
jgi:hypothetical protein